MTTPDGHSEIDNPLDNPQERYSETAFERLEDLTASEYGVPHGEGLPTHQTPEAVQENPELPDDHLNFALVSAISTVQIRADEHETNGWVPVQEVDAEIRTCYDATEVDDAAPECEVLADDRQRSRLVEVELDEHGEVWTHDSPTSTKRW